MSGAEQDSPNDELVARLSEASSLADDGDWAGALDLLLREEKRHPDDPTLLCMTGVALRETGAEDVAYDYFRRCVAQDTTDPLVLITAGSEIARWDDPDAERVLRLAALTAPHLALARLEYGAYLAREGHLESALVELEAARHLEASDSRVHLELGIALLLAGRTEGAITSLDESLSLAPDDAWVQGTYGLALVESGTLEEAAEHLLVASAAREDDWELHGAAALAAMAVGWEGEAWAAIARAEAVLEADRTLLQDLEELLEAGADDAAAFLREELAPPLLRQRLVDRS